jgi:pantothenate synthetase
MIQGNGDNKLGEGKDVVHLNRLSRYHEKPVMIICSMVCIHSGHCNIIPLLIVNKIGNVLTM